MYSCDIESLYTSTPTELGLEAIEYWILKNNNCLFVSKMFNQISGTAIDIKCAPPYACLTIGYQEEIKLFTQDLPQYFSNEECLLIKEYN